ncbi:MAG TPA: hypothetical protein VFB16_14710 [Bauldia sp.]|nr:hypothetical protein [Bauldia sp.]
MTGPEWVVVFAAAAHAIAVTAAIVKLVAWASGTVARLQVRLDAIEAKVDNDVAGRRIVAELRSDVAAIKATLIDLKEDVRNQRDRLERSLALGSADDA